MDESFIPEATRAWIYRICVAVVPLLTGYGVIEDSRAALWLGVAGAFLGFGSSLLAASNTSTKP
jgi:hypothetical protein